jgi:mannosyltransferase
MPRFLSHDGDRFMKWLKEHSVVMGSTALAALLSLLYLGSESIWVDEVYSILSATHHLTLTQLFIQDQGRMILYYIVLSHWLGLGHDEFTIRLLSALFSIAAVPFLYATARHLFDRRAAGFASLLFALNPFVIRYAQEARSYSLFLLMATVSTYFFVLYVQRRTRLAWIGWVIASVLGVYAHFFQLLIVGAHVMSLALLPRRSAPWAAGFVGILVVSACLIPIPLLAMEKGITGITWILLPDVILIFNAFRQFSGSLPAFLFIYLPLSGYAVWVGWRKMGHEWQGGEAWRYGLVLLWFFFPFLTVIVASYIAQPMFVPRYLIGIVPAGILLAGIGLSALKKPALWIVLGVLVLTSGRSIGKIYFETDNEQWREVTRTILQESTKADAIVCYAYFVGLPYEYYVGREGSPINAPQLVDVMSRDSADTRLSDMPPPDRRIIDSLSTVYPRVWLLLAHDFDYLGRGKDRELIEHALEKRYTKTSERVFTGVVVHLYVRRDAPQE